MVERGHFNHQERGEPPVQTGWMKEAINFLRVSHVSQYIAAPSLFLAVCQGLTAIEKASSGNYNAIDLVGMPLIWIACFAYSEKIAAANFSDYKRIKQALTKYGWDERIIETRSHSYCQRNTARVAASSCGYKQEIDQYFGGRW